MTKHRKAKKFKAKKIKSKPRKIKTVKLTPDTALKIVVPKDVVPSVITDPATGGVHIFPITADKLAKPGLFKWLLGR